MGFTASPREQGKASIAEESHHISRMSILEIDLSDKNWSDLKSVINRIIPHHEVDDLMFVFTCKDDPSIDFMLDFRDDLVSLNWEHGNIKAGSTIIASVGPERFDGKYIFAALNRPYDQRP